MSAAHDDLTGRARLRDAAIESFAARGFDESLRSIAARAGVTAGLVRHHFGSKEELRSECDTTVLERYRALKEESLNTAPAQLFSTFPSSREGGLLMVYILRSVRSGGAAGREFIEAMISEALSFSKTAVSRGLAVPSRDEEARARFLVLQSIGGMVVQLGMLPESALEDFQGVMEKFYQATALPTLELYTEGLFVDSSYLDSYLAYQAKSSNPPAGPAGESASR